MRQLGGQIPESSIANENGLKYKINFLIKILEYF